MKTIVQPKSAVNNARPHPILKGVGLALLVAGITVVVTGCGRQEPSMPEPIQETTKPSQGESAQLPSPVVDTTPVTQPKTRVFKADEIVAVIDGKELRLADLMPVGAGGEQKVSEEELKEMVDGYVMQEATFRKAAAEGIELTPQEKAGIAAEMAMPPNVTLTPEQKAVAEATMAQFQRHKEFSLLLDHLLQKQNVPAPKRPVSNTEVRAYYDQHRSDYPALPEGADQTDPAVQKVYRDIRNRLIGLNMLDYNRTKTEYAKEVQAQSGIKVSYNSNSYQLSP